MSESSDRGEAHGRGPVVTRRGQTLPVRLCGRPRNEILIAVREQLGEVLQADGRITREQAEWAADVAARNGARMGAVLVAAGLARRAQIYRVLRACGTARRLT